MLAKIRKEYYINITDMISKDIINNSSDMKNMLFMNLGILLA